MSREAKIKSIIDRVALTDNAKIDAYAFWTKQTDATIEKAIVLLDKSETVNSKRKW